MWESGTLNQQQSLDTKVFPDFKLHLGPNCINADVWCCTHMLTSAAAAAAADLWLTLNLFFPATIAAKWQRSQAYNKHKRSPRLPACTILNNGLLWVCDFTPFSPHRKENMGKRTLASERLLGSLFTLSYANANVIPPGFKNISWK